MVGYRHPATNKLGDRLIEKARPKYRILIIDDSAEDCEIYQRYLKQNTDSDYEFENTHSGRAGVAAYAEGKFDCVLLDYELPDLTGIQVLEGLTAKTQTGLPVVMITGRGDEKLAVQSLKMGAADYLIKSTLTPENVYRATRNAVEKYQIAVRLRDERTKLLEALAGESEALDLARRERERLRMFFDHIPSPIAVLRGEMMHLEYSNEPMHSLLRTIYDPGQTQSINSSSPPLGNEVLDLAQDVFKSGKHKTTKEIAIRREWDVGQPAFLKYFDVVIEPVREHDEGVSGLVMVMTEVSDQVYARQQVEASESQARDGESRFRQIAEIVPFLIWVADEKGSAEYLNSAWLNATGTRMEDNLGQAWLACVHPDDVAMVDRIWGESIATGQPFEITYRLRTPDPKQYKWYLSRGLPMRDDQGRILKWYAANADIHEQRTAADRIRSNENRFTVATANAKVGVWELDLTGRVVWRSMEHDRIFGYQEGLADWNVDLFLTHIFPEDRVRVERVLKEAMARSESYSAEFRVVWPDQSVHWVEVKGNPETNAGQTKYVGTILETTANKKREQELADARNNAVAANETKTAFLANMSHEIRTPLSAIMGFTDLIATSDFSPEEKRYYAEAVNRNGRALMQIIDDILDLSKIEAGKFSVEPQPTPLRKIVGDSVLLFRAKAAANDVLLDAKIEADVPELIQTDPVRLRQIVLNAVSNAVKFTESGSVHIQVKIQRSEEDSTPWIIIAIQDTGLGIAEDKQQRLFQAFSQADESMTRRYGGTGLGLMLARRLATLLGGTFYLARTAVGEGSTFELKLPLVPCTSEPFNLRAPVVPTDEPTLNPAELRDCRVLLVEDSEDNRELFTLYLERFGAKVETAMNGLEAIETVRKKSFDVIVTDIQMPVMDGYETLKLLRDTGFNKPVIALSAHILPESRKRSFEEGFSDHLAKPLRAEELVQTIRKHWNH